MAGTTGATFDCPQCGTKFIWRAPLAGKKVVCDCGREFVAPADKPLPPPPAQARTSSSAGNSVPPHLAAMYPTRQRPVEHASTVEEGDRGWVQSYVVPPILILLGLGIDITQVTWKKPELPSPVSVSPVEMAILIGLAVFTMLLGGMLVAMVLNVSFGRHEVAVFKATGITLFGTAVAVTLARLDTGVASITGLMMGWSSMILIYWACFANLFNLESHETVLILFVVAVGQALVLWAVLG